MKSKVHPTYKTKYRVANWPAYNQALVRRGDVTVWVSAEAIAAWTPRRSGRRGVQRRYSDLAIETALRRCCMKTRCAVLAHVVQNKEHLTLGVDRRSCSPSRPRSEVLQSLGDLVLGQKDRVVALPDLQCLGQQRPGAASGCV